MYNGYKIENIVWCNDNQLKELTTPNECRYFSANMKSVTELNKVNNLDLCI